ncbi:hypothetical protein EI94DRAFT_1737398 [Lactarius quietus]|nr:hypothetical protein EI94DRAFT_1737398 [Lactarius quietus]
MSPLSLPPWSLSSGHCPRRAAAVIVASVLAVVRAFLILIPGTFHHSCPKSSFSIRTLMSKNTTPNVKAKHVLNRRAAFTLQAVSRLKHVRLVRGKPLRVGYPTLLNRL